MPTKIALKGASPISNVSPRLRDSPGFFLQGLTHKDAEVAQVSTQKASSRSNRIGSGTKRTSQRSVVGFRSSIFRDVSDHSLLGDEADQVRLSADDIRASPRLMGYLFSSIASAVLVVSLVQFYRQEKEIPDEQIDENKYFVFQDGVIYRWKLWGALYVALIGLGLCLLTTLVHFDTVLLPKVWVAVFRDGSVAERNWILFLILLWAAGIYICTSMLSVGETQANVYFTTWIAFGSMALNFGVWRESAGYPSISEKVNLQHRETTYNWMWTCIFSTILAGSATDIYFNRAEIQLRLRGEQLNLDGKDWSLVLAVVWTEVAVCIMAIILNEWFDKPWRLPCVIHRPSGNYRFVFGWRQIEGLLIVTSIGAKCWVILEYTGVGGVINGLSNAYYGVWGSFFSTVFAFGTWLRENKNTEYIVKEPDEQEHRRRKS